MADGLTMAASPFTRWSQRRLPREFGQAVLGPIDLTRTRICIPARAKPLSGLS